MLRLSIVILTMAVSFPVFAQQQEQNDPIVLRRIISVLQAQRNQAQDNAAAVEVKAIGLTADLAKANDRIKELEPKEKSDVK